MRDPCFAFYDSMSCQAPKLGHDEDTCFCIWFCAKGTACLIWLWQPESMPVICCLSNGAGLGFLSGGVFSGIACVFMCVGIGKEDTSSGKRLF